MQGPLQKFEAVQGCDEKLGTPGDIHACAVCGVEDIQSVNHHSWEALGVLWLNDKVSALYEAILPAIRPHVFIQEVSGVRYWAHPELLNREGLPVLCMSCEHECIGQAPRRPPMSIAAGMHFGRQRDLPGLTPLEERMIAPVRPCLVTVKLTPLGGGAGGGWGIKGHAICLPHEGPEVAVRQLPSLLPLKETKAVFVGARTKWDKIAQDPECRAKIERIFTVRWDCLLKWLTVLKHINPLYKDFELPTVVPPEVAQHNGGILDRVEMCEDPDSVAMEAHATGDISRPEEGETEGVEDAILLAEGGVPANVARDVGHVVRTLRDIRGDPSTTFVHREGDALNEFTNNAHLLMGSFPTLFMCYKGVDSSGSVRDQHIRHFFFQFNRRFAENRDFLLLLFNQKIRHVALRAIRQKLRAAPSLLAKFEELINSPNLDERLREAEKNPNGRNAQKLVMEFLPLLRSCHGRVPFSSSERFAFLGKIQAMLVWFGLPSTFFTFFTPHAGRN